MTERHQIKRKISSLPWSTRLAFIEFYGPSEQEILSTFFVSLAELKTAIELKDDKTFHVDNTIDVEAIGNIFKRTWNKDDTIETEILPPVLRKTKNKTRGAKGTKIHEGFKHVPLTPTNVYTFSKQYKISLPVLRQSKRFDKYTSTGTVIVKQKINPNTNKKELMIWREPH